MAHFPGTCALFSQRNFIFHSLPPCASLCTRLQFISCDFQNFSPFSLKPLLSSYPEGKRLCEEEGHLLKCLILLCVRGMGNLRNVCVLAHMTQCNYETNWKRFPWEGKVGGGWDNMCVCQRFLSFFFLSLFSFFLIFVLSRLDFRWAVQKRGHVVPASPFKPKFTEWRTVWPIHWESCALHSYLSMKLPEKK